MVAVTFPSRILHTLFSLLAVQQSVTPEIIEPSRQRLCACDSGSVRFSKSNIDLSNAAPIPAEIIEDLNYTDGQRHEDIFEGSKHVELDDSVISTIPSLYDLLPKPNNTKTDVKIADSIESINIAGHPWELAKDDSHFLKRYTQRLLAKKVVYRDFMALRLSAEDNRLFNIVVNSPEFKIVADAIYGKGQWAIHFANTLHLRSNNQTTPAHLDYEEMTPMATTVLAYFDEVPAGLTFRVSTNQDSKTLRINSGGYLGGGVNSETFLAYCRSQNLSKSAIFEIGWSLVAAEKIQNNTNALDSLSSQSLWALAIRLEEIAVSLPTFKGKQSEYIDVTFSSEGPAFSIHSMNALHGRIPEKDENGNFKKTPPRLAVRLMALAEAKNMTTPSAPYLAFLAEHPEVEQRLEEQGIRIPSQPIIASPDAPQDKLEDLSSHPTGLGKPLNMAQYESSIT